LFLSGEDLTLQEVIQSGVVPSFVQFLRGGDFAVLQNEAAVVLALIIAKESNEVISVLDMGAIPVLICLLSCPAEYCCQIGIRTLQFVAVADPRCRDAALQGNVMDPLLRQVHGSPDMMQQVAVTLSALCSGKPDPDFAFIRPALPTLGQLICSSDELVLKHAVYALNCLSQGTEKQVQVTFDDGICSRLVELLLVAESLS
jgi:importin subunit alpha-6/7